MSIVKDSSGVNRDTDALVFARPSLSQATSDMDVVTKEKSVAEKPSDAMSDDAGESAYPAPF